jgi:hypothetical protein
MSRTMMPLADTLPKPSAVKALNSEQLDLEQQRGVRRDDPAGAARAPKSQLTHFDGPFGVAVGRASDRQRRAPPLLQVDVL